MLRTPSLHALRAFEAAARLGSFARASEELHLTPSAISHQVRALEQHFGKPLFTRSTRQVILTQEGVRLLAALSQAFAIIHTACADLSPRPRAESLSVHCSPSFAAKWLGPRLPGFITQNPDISIRLSSSADRVDLLRDDTIDVLIAYGTAPNDPGVTKQALGKEEIAALCSPALASAFPAVELEDFEHIMLLKSSFSPVHWAEWFSVNNLRPSSLRTGTVFDRGALVVAAAAQGLGVALETLRFAQAEIEAGSLVRFGGGRFCSLEREMHFLCYRTRDQNLKKIRRFCEWIIREITL
ncbi:MAG: LysR substrate-binding domain-containing protein [Beijerinckiaceae bacterium]|nr:LysR substrate-binding domain-containing protein [Brevundimonas sp.]MCZ8302112.1 LysR substrate-binding domain-containing protein [Beijerinckiaceae bacterium]